MNSIGAKAKILREQDGPAPSYVGLELSSLSRLREKLGVCKNTIGIFRTVQGQKQPQDTQMDVQQGRSERRQEAYTSAR